MTYFDIVKNIWQANFSTIAVSFYFLLNSIVLQMVNNTNNLQRNGLSNWFICNSPGISVVDATVLLNISSFFFQIANDEPPPDSCPAFVSIHGQHSCSTKEITKLLKAAAGR